MVANRIHPPDGDSYAASGSPSDLAIGAATQSPADRLDEAISTYLNRLTRRSFVIGRPIEAIIYGRGQHCYLLAYAAGEEDAAINEIGRWRFNFDLTFSSSDAEFLRNIIRANAQARSLNPAGKSGKAGSVSVSRIRRNHP